jgi:hypothetical protein
MEVKMKQLTSYFTSKSSSSPLGGGGGEDNNNNNKVPSSLADTSSGGEDGEEILNEVENATTTITTSESKKRPLHDNTAETEFDDNDDEFKKRRVDSDDYNIPTANPDESDRKVEAQKADAATTRTTSSSEEEEDPNAPIRPIGGSKDLEGESSTAPTNASTAVTCPLHFLASSIIISTSDARTASSRGDKVDTNEVPKIVSDDLIHEKNEVKEDNNDDDDRSSSINKSTTTDRVHTSLGESIEVEGGGGNNNENCPDTKPTPAHRGGEVDETTSNIIETTAVISQPTSNDEKLLPTRPNNNNNDDDDDGDSLSQKMDEVKCYTTTTTPAVLHYDEVEGNKSPQPKTTETTTRNNEDDTTMDVNRTTERNPTEQTPQQHVQDDSINVDMIYAAPTLHQEVTVNASKSSSPSSHPELSISSNNFESSSNAVKSIPPSVSQLKMALFLEASHVHAGCKPERIFANYWDALEEFIANPRSSSSSSSPYCGGVRSDPSYKFNATLELFLKTRKMKRLHNKLILALISDSVSDHVPANRSGDYIPREWRYKTRHLLHPKSDDSVELDDDNNNNNNMGSSDGSIRDSWKSSFGINADAWSACGNSVTIAPRIGQHEFIARKREEREEVSNEEIIPSCRLPGALGIDLFVRKTANDAGLTVSHDSMWLLIVAAREYASSIIGKAIDNDKDVTSGQTQRIPKSDYSSLSCEHLLVEKKGGKKKDSKKKESIGNAEKNKAARSTERNNDPDKKRKVLTCADISQVLQEQLVAAPRLAWMKSMGRGMAHHQPDLEVTNDLINASIQQAAIKRRRIADRKSAEAHVNVSVVPVAVIEGNLHEESVLMNEGLQVSVNEDSGRKTEPAMGNGPSSKINDSTTKAPPKSSDLLKSSIPPSKPTTEPSAVPAPSVPTPNVDSTTMNAPPTANVTQIRPVSRFGAKNLAALKARRNSSVCSVSESFTGKEEKEKEIHPQNQQQAAGRATQSQLQQPVPASISITTQSSGVDEREKLIQSKFRQQHEIATTTPLWQETEKTMQCQIQEELPQHKPADTSNANQLRQETEKMQSEVEQEDLPQYIPVATSNTGLWVETEKSMQSEVKQDELPQPKPVAKPNTSQLWQETEQTMQSQVERKI